MSASFQSKNTILLCFFYPWKYGGEVYLRDFFTQLLRCTTKDKASAKSRRPVGFFGPAFANAFAGSFIFQLL
ncbi:MAG TPA: hypothetical protein DCQ50_11350 [Chryseobacterium sp.]|nr:hypothetical protein [Chryseobacterium sp.]